MFYNSKNYIFFSKFLQSCLEYAFIIFLNYAISVKSFLDIGYMCLLSLFLNQFLQSFINNISFFQDLPSKICH